MDEFFTLMFVTHLPYYLLSLAGIIILYTLRKDLKKLNSMVK